MPMVGAAEAGAIVGVSVALTSGASVGTATGTAVVGLATGVGVAGA
jgi:hypothetical protein